MHTDYTAPSSSALSSLSLCLRSVSLCQSRKRATRGKKVARGKTDSLILLLADRGNRYNRVDASSFSTYNEPESPVDSKKIKNIRGRSTAIRENAKEAEEISSNERKLNFQAVTSVPRVYVYGAATLNAATAARGLRADRLGTDEARDNDRTLRKQRRRWNFRVARWK